jgi:type II secretory pathway pseudopilin PulG
MRRKKSFTLIEMIVVIATIGLVLPALFAIIFSILQQQVKIQRLSIVKREGDYVLNVMENTIRNYAVKIYSESSFTSERCTGENPTYGPSNGSNFFFRDKSDRWFSFYQNSNNISSNSANLSSPVNFNSSQTKITNFSVQCYRTALYSPPVINISFTISYNTSSSRAEETASFNYQTKVKLKSY